MDETLKWTVREARNLADQAQVALEDLEDLLVDLDEDQTEDVADDVKEALSAVRDLGAAVRAWRPDGGEMLPEQGELELARDCKPEA